MTPATTTGRGGPLARRLAAAEAEVTRLRQVVADHERLAAVVAEDAIGLYREYVDLHGRDEDSAAAAAVIEINDGMRAVDDTDPRGARPTASTTGTAVTAVDAGDGPR